MERRKDIFLFNDTLKTFYLQLYGGKEGNVFYLTMHSTHFIYGYMEGRKCFLFNDALNTFYLRLYGGKEGNGFFI